MSLPNPGDLFVGRYDVVSVLGSGGFATVVRAKDRQSGEDVAIKILAPRDDATNVVARFLLEAKVMRQLRCQHTLQLRDVGEAPGGLPYIVFEYIDGVTLEAFIADNGPIEHAQAVELTRQLLLSLDEAHGLGVTHRDLKPANVMIERTDAGPIAKLLDFGVAKIAPEAGGFALTRTGHLVGTIRYMAPEQLHSEATTPATDIYALGLILFEMLTGRPAHGDSQREAMVVMSSAEPIDIPPQVGPHLGAVLRGMLAKDPNGRFPTAAAVADALSRPAPSAPQPAATRSPSGSQPMGVRASNSRPLPAQHPSGSQPFGARRSEPIKAPTDRSRGARWLAAGIGAWVLLATAWWTLREPEKSPSPPRVAPTFVKAAPSIRAVAPKASDVAMAVDASVDVERDDAAVWTGSSSGCGVRQVTALHMPLKLKDSGRGIFVSTPKKYDPQQAYPLIVAWQCGFISHDQFEARMGLQSLVRRGGVEAVVAVVEPVNRFEPWVEDDISLAREAVEFMADRFCIDRAKIFAMGHGLGARMAQKMACGLPLAGLSVSGYAESASAEPCKPLQPTPTIWIRGELDDIYPTAGGRGCQGGSFLSAAEIDQNMLSHNACEGAAKNWERHCRVWSDCEAPYASCTAPGGYHLERTTWRHVFVGCEDAPLDISVARTAWKFFGKFASPQSAKSAKP